MILEQEVLFRLLLDRPSKSHGAGASGSAGPVSGSRVDHSEDVRQKPRAQGGEQHPRGAAKDVKRRDVQKVGKSASSDSLRPFRPEVSREIPGAGVGLEFSSEEERGAYLAEKKRRVAVLDAKMALLSQRSCPQRVQELEAGLRSVTKIVAEVSWPILAEGDKSVDRFIRNFEMTIGFANEGRGMKRSEAIIVLGNCLRGSRLDVYHQILMKEMETRTVPRDPEEVYQEILGRLREFAEGQFERQTRVMKEWNELQKGTESAFQFSLGSNLPSVSWNWLGLPRARGSSF